MTEDGSDIATLPQTNPIVVVNYTMQEVQAITNLLDIAAKAGGLAIAKDVAVIHDKHLRAVQSAHRPNPNALKEG